MVSAAFFVGIGLFFLIGLCVGAAVVAAAAFLKKRSGARLVDIGKDRKVRFHWLKHHSGENVRNKSVLAPGDVVGEVKVFSEKFMHRQPIDLKSSDLLKFVDDKNFPVIIHGLSHLKSLIMKRVGDLQTSLAVVESEASELRLDNIRLKQKVKVAEKEGIEFFTNQHMKIAKMNIPKKTGGSSAKY